MIGYARWVACTLVILVGVGFAEAQQSGTSNANSNSAYTPQAHPSHLLPNAFWVHKDLLSGGMPHGSAAFEELRRLGIKTIISVDGIKPDVDSAKQFGMRYVHLPHGYDGISKNRLMEITKALRELDKPIYLHCHHGKHRGPTAAAAACVSAGWLPPDFAPIILKTAGTNPAFKGLIETVTNATPMDPKTLDELKVQFVPVAEVPPIIEAMVAVDEVFDRLKENQKHGWSKSARADSLLLKEHFMELHRAESHGVHGIRQPEFQELLRQGLEATTMLETQWAKLEDAATPDAVLQHGHNDTMKRISQNCTQCHVQFRDNSTGQ
ncbi:MAG: hypothetical protein ACK5PZ_03475 [Pirellula sp.]